MSDIKPRRKRDGDLRRIFAQNLKEAQWTPIETAGTVTGVPDAEYCFPNGTSGWIEFKQTPLLIRPAQVSWILRRHRLGGRVYIAVKHKNELLMFSGADVVELKKRGLRGIKPVLVCEGGVKNWCWKSVLSLLTCL